MDEVSSSGKERTGGGIVNAAVSRLQLWNEARRSAKHDDSIFIWIPKNAGTSIYSLLRPHGLVKLKSPQAVRHYFRNSGRVTFGHVDIAALVEEGSVSRDFVANAFKFTIVRDPYDRAVSLYRYLDRKAFGDGDEKPPFRDFLKRLASGDYDPIGAYNERGLSQANPQVEWLRAAWPDKIYKIEKLDEFVADISEWWSVARLELPHLNRSGAGTGSELSRDDKLLIDQIYAEDFETFGYERR